MKMRCILADDEPLARKGLENFIRDIPFLELSASCSNAVEVMQVLADQPIDLLFLDIQMPKMSGMTLLKNLQHPPITIITTAYPNYAIESFDLAVLDYLVKPIPFDRFVKAVDKAKEYYTLVQKTKNSSDLATNFCFIKCDKMYEKIYYKDLLYVEALQNYVVLYEETKKHTTYLTLKGLEEQLPTSDFIKINKSHIVNLQKISRLDGSELTIGNTRLQIGRSFKESVMETILKGKLLKR